MSTTIDDRQLDLLRAVLDRIIPPDAYPGAWDAGCGEYICRQLSDQLAHLRPMYTAGLDGLEAEARSRFGRGFTEIRSEEQDAVLIHVETGDVVTNWNTDAQVFFSALVSHAAEGYYADPGQGGNRERMSWQMTGFQGK